MINALNKAIKWFDDSIKANVIKRNLNKYLGMIHDIKGEDSSYLDLLEKAKEIDEITANRRLLELVVFDRNKTLDSNDELFKIVFSLRTGNTDLAEEQRRNSIDIINKDLEKK